MSGFLTQEALGFPYWAWFACILGIACILIAIIIVACVVKGKTKEEDGEESASAGEQADEVKQEEIKEEKPAEVKEEVREEVKEEPESKPTAKPASTKSTAKTTTKSTPTKKSTSAKSTAAKVERSEAVAPKVYHISKRKEDGKWQVKAEGADKALRLFLTQQEAIDYAKKVAGNQEGRIVIHKEGGGFRKLNY